MKNRPRSSAPATLLLPLFLTGSALAQAPHEECSSGAPPRGAHRATAPSSDALSAVGFGFVENRGQWDGPARFIGSQGRARIFVEPDALTVAVSGQPGDEALPVTRFVFEGARGDARAEGAQPLPGVYNFYSGSTDRTEGVQRYERVLLRDVYEGVDVRLREHLGRLEYDVLLAPGADLEQVVVHCEGIERLELGEDGGLLLHTASGEVLAQSPPMTWAELGEGETRPLECRYVLLGPDRYGYALPERSADLPVVIDPGLEWSSFVGGSAYEEVYTLDRDPSGRLIVAGSSTTIGWTLPGVGAPFSVNNGGFDSYVAVIDPSATGNAQVVWWTFFGGSSDDWIWDIATNAAGEIFVAGDTQSPDFPITAGAFQQAHISGWDAYVTSLDPSSGTILASTYFGGSGWDTAQRIHVAEPSTVTIAGGTESPDLTMTPSAFDGGFDGNRDAYFAILDLSQTGPAMLQYSTYVGGSGQDGWVSERQLDFTRAASGVVTLVTSSFSTDFPVTANAYRSSLASSQDPVIVEIDPAIAGAAGLLYGSYIGTPAGEGVSQIEVDPTGGYYITGFTYSPVFVTTPGAPFRTFFGPATQNDAWLMRFDPSLVNPYTYATLVPGGGFEGFNSLKVDANGTAYGVGFTGAQNLVANNMPLTCNAIDKTFGGPNEGFLLALTPNGNGPSDVHYLGFVGGSTNDVALDVMVESTVGTPVVIVSGATRSTDLDVTTGAFQGTHGGDWDGFVQRLRLNNYLMCVANANSVSPDGAHVCSGGSTSLAMNNLVMTVTDLPPNSLGYFLMSQTATAPVALPAPSQGALCLGGTIVRFRAFVQDSGSIGSVAFQPDLGNIPPPGSPLAPGDTAYFQYWYRDTGGTSNTSRGMAVTFD